MAQECCWEWRWFSELDPVAVHGILALRQQIFMIEQQCFYLDADSFDIHSLHLLGREAGGEIICYVRLLPPGLRNNHPCLGRLATEKRYRGRGLGGEAMRRAIAKSRILYPGQALMISAQVHLCNFYKKHGFVASGRAYNEDGIVHRDMILESKS